MAEQTPWHEIETRLIVKAWKDEAFKQALLRDPKAVLERELGAPLPDDITVQVVEPPPNTLYLVLPPRRLRMLVR